MKVKISETIDVIYILFSFMVLILAITGIVSSHRVMMHLLIIVFFFLFYLTTKRRNFSIFQIFLISYFVFLLSRIFLDCLGLFDMRYMNHFQRVYMQNSDALKTVNLLTVFLIGMSYAWLLYGNSDEGRLLKDNIKTLKINNLVKALFYIYLFLFLGKLYFILRAVKTYGYLAIFNGTVSSISTPAIFYGAATITETLYIILLYYNRDEQSFKLYSGLMLLTGIVKTFTGQRGYGLVLMMFILYMYSTYYREIKITNWKIIALGVLLPIVIQYIYNLRYGMDTGLRKMLYNNVYVQVLESIGGPLEAVANTIIHNDEFTNKVPFLLGYFIDFFEHEPSGQVIEDITNGNYLGDHLTYTINSRAFFAGHGMGTSIVAESYSTLGKSLIFVFLFSFLLCLVIHYIAKKSYKNIYLFALSYFLLTDFIFSPRGSVFSSLRAVAFAFFVCFIIQWIQYMNNRQFVKA